MRPEVQTGLLALGPCCIAIVAAASEDTFGSAWARPRHAIVVLTRGYRAPGGYDAFPKHARALAELTGATATIPGGTKPTSSVKREYRSPS
jgi:hypothetical protein